MIANKKGFTLWEILIVLIILAIGMYMLISNSSYYKTIGEEKQMTSKAIELNNAMSAYMMDQNVRTQINTWKSKTNDERYALLKPYLQYAVEDVSKFLIEGYECVFPDDPRNRVVIKKPDGTDLSY